MNCQDIARLLDDRDIASLGAAERGDAELHVATCPRCASGWNAHMRLLGVCVPPLPDRLAGRCRPLLAGAFAYRDERRVRARPVLVAGLLLAGAAAAAMFGTQWLESASDESASATVAGTPAESAAAPSAPGASAAALASSSEAPAGAAAASPDAPTVERAGAAASGGFTVAVPPLTHLSDHPDVVAITEAIHAAMLDELGAVPGLEVIELDAPAAGFSQTIAFAPTQGANVVMDVRANTVTMSGGFNVDMTRTTAAESGASPGVVFNVQEFADAADPAGTVNTIFFEGVRASAEGTAVAPGDAPQVFNFTLARNAAIVDVAAASATAVQPAVVPAGDYDYLVNVTSVAVLDTSTGRPDSFSYRVRGMRAGGGAGQVSLAMDAKVYERVDSADMAREVVEQLRKTLFEPDDALLEELRAAVLNQSAPLDARLGALAELQAVASRSGLDGRTGLVAAAAVEMARNASAPGQRARVWRLMRGSSDPALVQPLTDALLYDANALVRVEAANALATFASDPAARAALESAGSFDASAEVRLHARWSSLDESGRRDFVAATLLDTSLSDAERLKPLLFSGRSERPSFGPPAGTNVEGPAAAALIDIIGRTADHRRRSMLMPYLNGADQPEVIAFMIDRLEDDSAQVRIAAASALGARLNAPGARAALERAAATDGSDVVRNLATSMLARPVVVLSGDAP